MLAADYMYSLMYASFAENASKRMFCLLFLFQDFFNLEVEHKFCSIFQVAKVLYMIYHIQEKANRDHLHTELQNLLLQHCPDNVKSKIQDEEKRNQQYAAKFDKLVQQDAFKKLRNHVVCCNITPVLKTSTMNRTCFNH